MSCFMFFATIKMCNNNVRPDLKQTSKIVGQITNALTTTRRTGQVDKGLLLFSHLILTT